MTRLSLEQANAWRLRRHYLSRKATKKELPKVVSDVCGIQAQVLSAAELGIRARVEGLSQQDVRDALWKSHTIVKTWCMRGTLHILASTDLPLYVAALRSKQPEFIRWLQKNGGVTPAEVSSITDGIRDALSNKLLTREELSREVAQRAKLKPKTKKYLMSAWGVLLRPAAFEGQLAFGESLGPKVRFVNPTDWIVPWKEPSTKDAFLELFRRYLRSYGPIAVKDFGHWWGNLSEHEKSDLGSFVRELEPVELDGFRGLMLKSDAKETSNLEPASGVHLLPSFDCYVMFNSPRELFISGTHRNMVFRKEAGWVFPALVVDGRAAGVWSFKRRSRGILIEVEPFRNLKPREKEGVRSEAIDIARFLGTSAEVRYGPIGPV
ncbi:MAG TPA: winged helix DNA-binding domain-containing protein [Nitrososphaerales archaeon]|nr:winged helix DNA-binding domain-containing protein [Nitrososphaerales archaeon]